MSHRNHWTHLLTATRKAQTGTDEYDSPIYGDSEAVVEDEPVRFRSGGTSYVRYGTGERVERSDTLKGRGELSIQLQEGDELELEPLSPDAESITGVEVAGIEPQQGRGVRSEGTIIELEGV